MCFPHIFHVKIWFTSNKFFSLFCSFIRRKEKRKVLLSRTRGRKCHMLKFYFVVLDGVDRRYVNAQREVDEKGYSRRRERIGKSRRTTSRCMFHGRYNRTSFWTCKSNRGYSLTRMFFPSLYWTKILIFWFEGTYECNMSIGKWS